MGKYKKLLKRVERIEKYISDNTEVVVELTELPEKWCIELNKENIESINVWIEKDSSFYGLLIDFGYIYYNRNWTAFFDNECTEITFYQFKKWVLKEDVVKYDTPEEVGKSAKIEYRPSVTFESIEDFCLDQLKDKYAITLKKTDIGNTDTSSSIRNIQVKVTSQEKANECIFIAKSYGEEISDIATYAYGLYFGYNGSRHDGKFGFYYYDKNQEEISMYEFRHRFGSKKIKPVESDTVNKPDLSNSEGSQSQSKVVESDHLKEIDWSNPGQLVENEKGNVFSITKEVSVHCFEARSIFCEGKTILDNTIYILDKEYFKLCTEPITLSN